jgi:hypothetical protein
MASQLQPTALESALLDTFHALYAKDGFPHPKQISLVSRDNTGAGRYVELSVSGSEMKHDGYLDLGGKFIEIEGVSDGMMAVVFITDGAPKILELTVYGGEGWDGIERPWAIK